MYYKISAKKDLKIKFVYFCDSYFHKLNRFVSETVVVCLTAPR